MGSHGGQSEGTPNQRHSHHASRSDDPKGRSQWPLVALMKPLLVGMLFIEDRRHSPRQHDYHVRHDDTDREPEDSTSKTETGDTPATRRAPSYGTTGPPPQEYDADDSPQPATY